MLVPSVFKYFKPNINLVKLSDCEQELLFFVVVIFYNTAFTGIQNKHLEGETAETGQQ